MSLGTSGIMPNGTTILIISRDEEALAYLQTTLMEDGYAILTCDDEQQALTLCETEPVQIVILDSSFNDGHSIGLCQQIDALDVVAPPKILMLLDTEDRNVIRLVLLAGALDILVKPLVPTLVRQRIYWILQSMRTAELHDALQESEERLRTIVTNANLILFAFDATGKITFIDGKGLSSAGLSADQLLGQSILDQSVNSLAEDARLVFSTRKPQTSTIAFNDRYFETMYNPLFDSDGRVTSVIGVATDITVREQVEKFLGQSLSFYLSLFEDFPVPVWRAGIDAKLDYVNQSWLTFTGQTLDDAIQAGWMESIHPEDRLNWRDSYVMAFRHQKPFEVEYRMRRHDGTYRPVVNIGKPFFGMDEVFAGYIGLIYDITERKEGEERMVDLKLERERVKLLQEFISTISHDLKTPLSSIILYASLLRKTNTPMQRHEYSRVVEEQSHRLQQMLDNMIEMSRLDEEITTLTFKMIDISSVTESIAHFYSVAAKKKNLEYVVQIDSPLPHVLANEAELRRGLGNLIDNAIKYTDHGTITVRAFADKTGVIIEVRDTGIGIAETDLPRIFDRFYRADKARGAVGTGLGLSIVKKIVDAHGGTIDVDSALNLGTNIRVNLPIPDRIFMDTEA